MQNKVQGGYKLELKFVDETRVYLNFWDLIHGNDVCCQIKDGKFYKFVHSQLELERDEIKDNPLIQEPLQQKEISVNEFLELVQYSILKQS